MGPNDFEPLMNVVEARGLAGGDCGWKFGADGFWSGITFITGDFEPLMKVGFTDNCPFAGFCAVDSAGAGAT